jgi:hypothetical protein
MKISILVVLYNKKPQHSMTLTSLLKLNVINSELTIWNNGPNKLDFDNIDDDLIKELDQHFDCINILETIDNISLSNIYNQFIKNQFANKYIILDHDSELNSSYFHDLTNSNNMLLLPKVMSNDSMCSPSRLPKNTTTYKAKQHFSAITSGMVVSHELVAKLEARFGDVFDEHYAFYGIDTSFMLRMKKLAICDKITVIKGFSHSLSKNEHESSTVKQFRSRELAISTALTTRHYPSYSSYRRFFKSIIKSLRGKNDYPIKEMLLAFYSGNHPKCRR